MATRAVRGATQVEIDEPQAIYDAVAELVLEVLRRNSLSTGDLISIIFTSTPDLRSDFPAYAARQIGLTDVPLLGATEVDVDGAIPRIVRLLAHVDTTAPRSDIRHVYLRGAAALRSDLPR